MCNTHTHLYDRLFIIITPILIVVGNLNLKYQGHLFSLLRKLNYDIFRTRNVKFRGFVLLGWAWRVTEVEGALNYFILGVVSSAIFLLGV